MVDDDFVLKGGKYAGETYGSVKIKNPSYIKWVEVNAPGLLKEKKVKISTPAIKKLPKDGEEQKSAIQPNLNFFNEGSKKS